MKKLSNNQVKTVIFGFLLIFLGVFKSNAANFVVTNLNQCAGWNNAAGDGSFYGALKSVNAQPAGTSHTISFNLNPATYGPGPYNFDIQATMVVTNSVSIDGFTQGGTTCSNLQIVFQGQGWTLLTLTNTNSLVKGLVFQGYPLTFSGGSGNRVYNCFFNLNNTGTVATGIGNPSNLLVFDNSTNNIAGGVTACTRNVFSGAGSTNNCVIVRNNSNGTKIVGNYIGTAANNGTTFTAGFAGDGINIANSTTVIVDSNIVAGTAGNAISINSTSTTAQVRANYVGLGADGITNYPANKNGRGIVVGSSSGVKIQNNVVVNSGIGGGIFTNGGSTDNLEISGNTIGLRADGTVTATNYGNYFSGVYIFANANGILIDNNVACSNGLEAAHNAYNSGIYLRGEGMTITNVTISNNFVGVSRNYTKSGNDFAGVYLQGSGGTISNVTVSGNTIGDNGNDPGQKSSGIATLDITSGNIQILGNYIGMTPAGADIGNYHNGIEIFNTSGITIGGTTTATQRNYIGYNKAFRNYANAGPNDSYYGAGILITSSGATASNATIINNYIGVNPSGTAAPQITTAGHSYNNGIVVENTSNVIIGGTNANEPNVIANMAYDGILVIRAADNVQIRRNSIYCNGAKGIDLNLASAFTFTPGNNSYPAPVITNQTASTVSGTSNANATIEIFYDADGACARACADPNKRQGKVYIATVTANAGGAWTYNNGSAFTGNLTATATGDCSGGNCRTSEFSTCNLTCASTITSGSATACAGTSGTYSTTDAGPWVWSVTGTGASFTGQGTNSISVTFGTGNVTITLNSGTCNQATMSVTVSAPPTSNAGTTQNLCNVTSTTLAANTPTAPATGSWTLNSGPNTPTITTPSSPSSTVTGMIPGTYVFKWTVSNAPCTAASSTVSVTISAPPTSNAGSAQNLCNVTSTTLAANTPTAPATGAWTLTSGPNTPTITTPSSPTSTVTGMIAGTYVLTWTVSNGACTAATSTVTIVISAPPTSNAGSAQNLCNVTSTTLAATTPTAPATGAWTLTSGPNTPTITTPSSPTSTVTGMIAGTYVLTWTVSNGACTAATSTVTIVISAPPTSNAGSAQNLCNVTSTTLAATAPTAPATGAWTLTSGPNTPTITTPSSPTSTVTGMIAGTYVLTWTVSNGTCTAATSTVTIVISAPPTSNAGSAQNLCNVTSTTLAATAPTSPATGAWTLTSGPNTPTITTPSSPTSTVTGMIAGTYVLTWTVSNGTCTAATSTVTIVISAPPTSNAGSAQNLCNVTSTTLAATTPTAPATGAWTLTSGPNTPTITTPSSPTSTLTSMIAGTYVLTWTVSNGTCTAATSTVTIINSAQPTSNAGTAQNLCNVTSTTLAANTPTAPATGAWTLTSGPNTPTITTLSSPTSTVTGMIPGTYVLTWTVSNGTCTAATSTVTITNNSGTIVDGGVDQDLCNATSTTLAATVPTLPATGTWSFTSGPNTPTITTPASATSTVTGMIPGTYVLTWTVSGGSCATNTSNVTIVNRVQPTSNAGTAQNLCNVTSTILAATAPTAPATGAWTLTSGPNTPTIVSPASETSTVTGLVAGTYVLTWTVSNGNCTAATSTVNIVNSAQPISNAGTAQNLCNQTSTTLAATAATSPATGAWSFTSGPNTPTITTPASETSTLTGMIPGTYVLTWTVSNGTCTAATSTVSITNSAQPTSNAGIDQDLCNASSTILAATAATSPATGAWSITSGPNTPTITTPSSESSTLTGMVSGTYVLTWTVSNGTCTAATSTVTINNNATISSTAGSAQNLCNATSTTLAATAAVSPATGLWTLTSGPNTPTITTPGSETSTVTGMVPGTYVLTWTVSNGSCTAASSTVNIVNSPLPAATTAGTDQPICADNTVLAAGTPASGTGTWYLVSGTGTITDPLNPSSAVTNISFGVLKLEWVITSGTCTAERDTVVITRNPATLSADAGEPRTICSGPITLSANVAGAGTVGTWSVTSGSATFVDDHSATTSSNGFTTGANTLTWTITGPCGNSSDDVVITVGSNNLSIVASAADDTLCLGTPADIYATVTGSTATPFTFTWTSTDGFSLVTQNSGVTVNPSSAGWVYYTVTVVDANNCSASPAGIDSLYAVGQQTLIVPNLITPNADQHNDCLIIRDVNDFDIIPGSKFELYNRWGEAVYKNNHYKNGDFCGASLSDGMYFYYIKTSCDHREIKGWLHIIGNEASNK